MGYVNTIMKHVPLFRRIMDFIIKCHLAACYVNYNDCYLLMNFEKAQI